MWLFKWKLLSSTFLWCFLWSCSGHCKALYATWHEKGERQWLTRWFKLLSVTTHQMKITSFLWCRLLCCTRGVLRWVWLVSKPVGKILNCVHSNQSYWAALFCDSVCFAVHFGSLESVGKIFKWLTIETKSAKQYCTSLWHRFEQYFPVFPVFQYVTKILVSFFFFKFWALLQAVIPSPAIILYERNGTARLICPKG